MYIENHTDATLPETTLPHQPAKNSWQPSHTVPDGPEERDWDEPEFDEEMNGSPDHALTLEGLGSTPSSLMSFTEHLPTPLSLEVTTVGISKESSNLEDAYEQPSNKPSAPLNIDALIAQAERIYGYTKAKEKILVEERIDMGRILINLKSEVGHGKFIRMFQEWNSLGKISFSLSTADRAMAYEELADAGKLRSVTNLAEAERIRKAEAARKKAANRVANTGGDEKPEESAGGSLTKERINVKAKQLAKPALDECRCYEAETKRFLLEELIEILTNELEQSA